MLIYIFLSIIEEIPNPAMLLDDLETSGCDEGESITGEDNAQKSTDDEETKDEENINRMV